MRQKRAKQIKRVLGFTGHTTNVNEKGQRIVSQYRRFKKAYVRNKADILPMVNKMYRIMIQAKKDEAKENAPEVVPEVVPI